MPKPIVLPRWANVLVGATVAPLSGKQDNGFSANDNPAPEHINWLFYYNYKWAEYLNSGNLEGAFTFNSTVAISGNTTVGGTFGSTGVITASAGMIVGNNKDIVISGTGKYKHGDVTKTLSLLNLTVIAPSAWSAAFHPNSSYEFVVSGPPNNISSLDLQMNEGQRIKSVKIRFNNNASGSTSTVNIYQLSGDAPVSLGSFSLGGSGTGWVDVTCTLATPYVVPAYTSVFLEINGGSTLHKFKKFQVTYDTL